MNGRGNDSRSNGGNGLIKLEHVTKVYSTGTFGGKAMTAVRDVSFEVNPERSCRLSVRAAAASPPSAR
jgi:ABC-type glutathione transport system ATPase component